MTAGDAASKPRYTLHDGFRMPMGFPVESFESGQRYRAQPGDLFVATYPKCGTTWTQYIIYLLVSGGQPLVAGQSLTDVFPHLEEVGEEAIRGLPEPRLIKTHLPFERTPWNAESRYVYVARNPFDCAVSFYHHTRGFVRHYDFAEGTFDTFFECFVRGEVDFGDYFDHLLSWIAYRNEPNLLFLTYEAMLRAPREAVQKIARFAGLEANGALLDRVVELASFKSMRREQSRWSSRRPAGMPEFVRKGMAGDWRSEFSPAQARRLAARFVERTRGTSAAALWPDVLAAAEEYV